MYFSASVGVNFVRQFPLYWTLTWSSSWWIFWSYDAKGKIAYFNFLLT